jgi:hypothetical protein
MEATQMTLPELCESSGVKLAFQFVRYEPKSTANDWEHNAWKVTLTYQGRRLTTTYNTGMAHKEPEVAGVVSSLILDAKVEGTFEEFCRELGYDPDSRKAEKIYRACARIAPKVRKLFGADFEVFQLASQEY